MERRTPNAGTPGTSGTSGIPSCAGTAGMAGTAGILLKSVRQYSGGFLVLRVELSISGAFSCTFLVDYECCYAGDCGDECSYWVFGNGVQVWGYDHVLFGCVHSKVVFAVAVDVDDDVVFADLGR